MENSIY